MKKIESIYQVHQSVLCARTKVYLRLVKSQTNHHNERSQLQA